ncbi:MAG: response regulator transcription factor [Eubacteriales bacterium]
MPRILIVDDEVNIRAILRRYAELEGHEVVEAKDGLEALNKVKIKDFDIILMDIMMPELDGFSAYKEIHKLKKIPVIMLSARGEEYDKLYGFELGIDDYVVKPFSPKEVMARVNAVIKRCGEPKVEQLDKASFEGLEIDFTGRDVLVDGRKIKLKPKEYELLFYLVKNRNVALTRDKILNGVWGYDYYLDDRTIDAHIKAIRAGIGKYRKYIVTMRGIGYKFEV